MGSERVPGLHFVRWGSNDLTNDRETESGIRRVVPRGAGQSGRTFIREMGSLFRDARSRQELDRYFTTSGVQLVQHN